MCKHSNAHPLIVVVNSEVTDGYVSFASETMFSTSNVFARMCVVRPYPNGIGSFTYNKVS